MIRLPDFTHLDLRVPFRGVVRIAVVVLGIREAPWRVGHGHFSRQRRGHPAQYVFPLLAEARMKLVREAWRIVAWRHRARGSIARRQRSWGQHRLQRTDKLLRQLSNSFLTCPKLVGSSSSPSKESSSDARLQIQSLSRAGGEHHYPRGGKSGATRPLVPTWPCHMYRPGGNPGGGPPEGSIPPGPWCCS